MHRSDLRTILYDIIVLDPRHYDSNFIGKLLVALFNMRQMHSPRSSPHPLSFPVCVCVYASSVTAKKSNTEMGLRLFQPCYEDINCQLKPLKWTEEKRPVWLPKSCAVSVPKARQRSWRTAMSQFTPSTIKCPGYRHHIAIIKLLYFSWICKRAWGGA